MKQTGQRILGRIGPRGRAPVAAPCIVAQSTILPLTDTEKAQMRQCEAVVRAGLATFFEVGQALLTIREGHLYRSTFATFELYCRERWGIGRSYAWRVIGAAERVRLLPADEAMPRPSNECQIRPFLKLEPSEFPGAWTEAVSRAKGGKVTPKLLASVVGELCERTHVTVRKHKGAMAGRRDRSISLGRVLALIQEARHQMEKGDVEQALTALDNVEGALFGGDHSVEHNSLH